MSYVTFCRLGIWRFSDGMEGEPDMDASIHMSCGVW
jgi:hypothetical protein